MKEHIPERSSSYFPALDTFRTIAVGFVIISHWLPYDHWVNSMLPNGAIGVTLFFVLSGFLITSGLLVEKEKIEASEVKTATVFKHFYLRRGLRILPVYYVTLVILLLISVPFITRDFWWHFGFLSNILFYLKHSWVNEFVSPLWSLSVEEQFYLVWPLLILFAPRNRLLLIFTFTIALGTGLRMLPANVNAHPYSFLQVLTPLCIDCFAVGGMIAYFKLYHPSGLRRLQLVFNIGSLAGLLYLLVISPFFLRMDWINVVFHRTIFSAFAGCYILFVITRSTHKNWLSKDLENGVTIFIGKLSYSMYLWHNLIPYLTEIESDHQRFFARLALLLVLSTLSYFVLERPLLSLKKYIKD